MNTADNLLNAMITAFYESKSNYVTFFALPPRPLKLELCDVYKSLMNLIRRKF